jgi:hypothetical protein
MGVNISANAGIPVRRIFSMHRYEVKYFGREEWEEISEINILERLFKAFQRVTPAVEELIAGKAVLTSEAIYRIKEK